MKNKKLLIIVFLITAAVLGVMAVSSKTGRQAGGGVGAVFAPAQKLVAISVNTVSGFFADIKNSSSNAAQNKQLKKKAAELSDEIRMLEGYKTENEQLRKLLELKNTRDEMEYTAANIIGRDSDDMYHILTIDKGTDDGIKQDAVVTVPDGLVGSVCETGRHFAKVRTVLDAESAVSVICARSGDMGIVDGGSAAGNNSCTMGYIDKDAKIVVGDFVETSGTGGIFPRGILVGKIRSIKNDERNLSLNATVETGVKLRSISEVLVSIEK